MPSKMKTCEDYRGLLIDDAAVGSAPSYELRSHLDVCVTCRTAFTEEKQLFAAIDSGLRATANAEAPPSLLAQVRTQVNTLRAPRFSWVPASAAIAAVATIVLTVAYVREGGRGGFEQNPRAISARDSHVVASASIQPSPLAAAPITMTTPRAKGKLVQPLKTPGIAAAAAFEAAKVIVPTAEKRGMQALLTNLQQGKAGGELLRSANEEKPLEELQVSPLFIAPIEVKPLVEVNTGPASENEETKR